MIFKLPITIPLSWCWLLAQKNISYLLVAQMILIGNSKTVIYAGFFGWGWSTKCLGGPIFRGWNENLLLGKALKFGVIVQKYALKLIKNLKNIEKSREKCNFCKVNKFYITDFDKFPEKFSTFGGLRPRARIISCPY